MKPPRLLPLAALLLALFALLSLACGNVQQAAQKSKNRNELMSIGMMYHSYFGATNKAPTKVEDLDSYAFSTTDRDALQNLRFGKYTIIWGVKPTEMLDGSSNTVLAYEPSVQTSKGYVLFGDGSVREMTSSEFSTKPKAKPKLGGIK